MQLKRIGLIVTPALAALLAAGCGPDDGMPGMCTSDTACAENELCHPVERICVQTCTAGADCPSSAKTCAPLGAALADGGTDTRSVCQCSTTPLCNADGVATDLVCNDETRICVAKCTSNADCGTGRTCETATGQCKASAATCTKQGTCPSGNICNFSNGTCEAPKTCSSTTQPDTCSYGQFCSGASCAEVPAATCANFSASAHGASWTSGSTGPITYSLVQEGASVPATGCSNFTARVKAYRTSGTFPSTRLTLKDVFHMVQPNGTEIATDTIIDGTSIQVTNGGRNIEFLIKPCAIMPYSLGVHFDQGNEICAAVQ